MSCGWMIHGGCGNNAGKVLERNRIKGREEVEILPIGVVISD